MDPTWLCWKPVSRYTAQRILSQLRTFFQTFDELRDLKRPWQSGYDRAMEHAAYAHAREKAFLGYTWNTESHRTTVGAVFSSPLPRAPHVQDAEPPAFPEERFMDFLLDGWRVGGRYSFRDMLITALLNGGGPRASEVLHLYVTDILPDPELPESALVLFHHPVEGAAPEDWKDVSGNFRSGQRRDYLRERWGLQPRNLQLGAQHAGWKGAALTSDYGSKVFRLHWFPPQLGIIFMRIWERYLIDLTYLTRTHPYAFVNILRGEKGAQYTLSAFRGAHSAAVERIGLEVSRLLGTVPHGHRHAYGGRLARAGVPGHDIQNFMHHCSYESHLVYTRPFQKEVVQALSKASSVLAGSEASRKWDSYVGEVDYRMRTA
jgi:integrase